MIKLDRISCDCEDQQCYISGYINTVSGGEYFVNIKVDSCDNFRSFDAAPYVVYLKDVDAIISEANDFISLNEDARRYFKTDAGSGGVFRYVWNPEFTFFSETEWMVLFADGRFLNRDNVYGFALEYDEYRIVGFSDWSDAEES